MRPSSFPQTGFVRMTKNLTCNSLDKFAITLRSNVFVLLMAFVASHPALAGEPKETPDIIDVTELPEFPEPVAVPGPLSQLDKELVLSAFHGKLNEVEVLVGKGADVNAQDQKGHTPLIFAATNGHTPVVKFLVGAGAHLDTTDSSGQTALMYACKRSFNETAAFLIESGADVNRQSKKTKVTALMLAAVWNNVELTEMLLESGADPNLTDLRGRTAKTLAKAKGNSAIVELLPDPPETQD